MTSSATAVRATYCEFILRTEGSGTVRCAAEAVDGSTYCPVHRDGRPIATAPVRRPKREVQDDVLPWAEEDCAVFEQHERKRLEQERTTGSRMPL